MNAISHRQRLREQMEATARNYASFKPMDPIAEVELPTGFNTDSSVAVGETVVEAPSSEAVAFEEETDTPPSVSAAAYEGIAEFLPAKPDPLTDENRGEYVEALLEALLGMEASDYQDALLYLHSDDPEVYQAVYEQLADDAEDTPGSDSTSE